MTLLLSRLVLDPRCREVRRDLGDVRALHRTVMGAFPDLPASPASPASSSAGRTSPSPRPGDAARRALGVLFRLDLPPVAGLPARPDPLPLAALPTLLVQSAAAPDWSRLPDDYLATLFDGSDNPGTKALDAGYAAITAGDVLAFRLRANPTKRLHANRADPTHPDHDPKAGKRVALHAEEDRLAWLNRAGERGGFALVSLAGAAAPTDDVVIQPEGVVHGDQRLRERQLSFGAVLFEGRLRVTDADAFRATLAAGIGSGKAFGFGLLSVARVGPGAGIAR